MRIESAKYSKGSPPDQGHTDIWVLVTLEGDDVIRHAPLVDGNRHYEAVKEWVAAGNTITASD
tara:strand:- start:97 stop:285 length:189 start_codon:yes stop_codon:yes gene_type:complete